MVLTQQPPRDLGPGLRLRFAIPADTEAIADFNGHVHSEGSGFNSIVVGTTRDLISEKHPTCGAANFTLVEDTGAGNKIVSSMCLIPQTWTYAGIPFEVGRPELVGTDPAYRRRGLVRAQFEALHARSEAMGHHVQAVTGILWFYRQFGYEYALELSGGRIGYWANIPALKASEAELYRLRPMTLDDLPFVRPLYERECARSLVACPRTEALWRHLLTGYTPGTYEARPYQIIETAEGRAAGYIAPQIELWGSLFVIVELAVAEGQSLRAVTPSTLRALRQQAEATAASQKKEVNALYFAFGREHPLYTAVADYLPKTRPNYSWYLRVPDVPGFLRHIAPALEARLARSPLAGYTGELKVNEFTSGFRLAFEKGKLTASEPWRPKDGEDDDRANFPPLVFLQLLFGFRSLAELRAAFPDCYGNDESLVLLDVLFPRQSSNVVPLG